jgi:N-methylhydantoinase B
MEISLYPTYNVLSKMIFGDEKMRQDIMCIGGTSQWPATIFRGTDQWGDPYGYLLVDPIGGAIGAFAGADGISTGGQSRTPICKLPNIEHTEQTFPLLFLYRKEVVDSGGAGKFRGGMSAESCFIPHGTTSVTHDTLSSGNAIPTSTGMMGGYPASVNIYKFQRDSNIDQMFKSSTLPGDIDEVGGREETLGLRQQNFTQNPRDVYSVTWTGGGGFGDPLERDPTKVAFDVTENMAVSAEAARQIYGVVMAADGSLDAPATEQLRRQRRHERQQHPRSAQAPALRQLDGKLLREATANLCVRLDPKAPTKERKRWCCMACATDLGPLQQNYKLGCAMETLPISASNPLIGDYRRYINDEPVFRQFFCPGCGQLIENEIALAGDELLCDIQIKV